MPAMNSNDLGRGAIGKRFGRLFRSFAALAGSGGVVVVALQCIWWFQDGFWSPKTLLDLWLWLGNSYSIRSSGETERVALWVLDFPLGAVLLVVAAGSFWIGKRLDA